MTTFLVINNNDSGSGSLRQAILNAEESSNPGADTIEFAPWMTGQTIFLSETLTIQSGNLTINGDINGDGDPDITISGDSGDDGRSPDDVGTLLLVDFNATARINSLILADGTYYGANTGGTYGPGYITPVARSGLAGIENRGTLTLTDNVITNMYSKGGNGDSSYGIYGLAGGQGTAGILNSGQLTITDTALEGLTAKGGNGANGYGAYDGGDGGRAQVGILNGFGNISLRNVGFNNINALGGQGGAGDGAARTGGNGGEATAGIWIYNGTYVSVGYSALGAFTANPGSGGSGLGGADPGVPGYYYAPVRSAPGILTDYDSGFTQSDDTRPTTGPGQRMFGFAGDDVLTDGFGGGKLYGGSGDDFLSSYGANVIAYGGSGNDRIKNLSLNANTIMDGGKGNDLLDVSADSWSFKLNMTTGSAKTIDPNNPTNLYALTARNFENVIGTNHVDNITGTNGANTIAGNDGDDNLKGLGGNDQILGGKGDDDIRGGDANDILRGGNNIDTLRGDNGNDIVHGGSGADFLFGGNANDRLRGGDGSDELQGDRGNDVLRGGGGKDTFIFGKGFDKDSVRDFTDNTDQIALNDNLWKGTLSKTQILNQFATLKGNGDVVFDFGHGDIFTIK
ncbi:MAG: hypothetical protein KDJ19_05075, partial [Hyphomicrobiaceae bacterium]|nr:hypothetical protein [Hyphomicrobiaceae bacterium]